MDHTRELLDSNDGLGARDALHTAVVVEYGLEAICSYDRGFDMTGIRRVEPKEIPYRLQSGVR